MAASLGSLRCALARSQTAGRACFPTSQLRRLTTLPDQPTVLKIGQSAEARKVFTAEDIETFAKLSGDYNPIHLSAEYAATTMFKKPIVYGVLMNG